jgi:hypothetical protein
VTTETLDRDTARGPLRGRSVSLLAATVAFAVAVVASDVPYSIARTVCSGFAAANVSVANVGFYLHVVRHGRFWSFTEGLRRGAV